MVDYLTPNIPGKPAALLPPNYHYLLSQNESDLQKFPIAQIPSHGPPASYTAQILINITIAILCLWSTFGNLVTILGITTQPYMRSKCNIFILSLAFSDLFSGLIASPLWLYRRTWGFRGWSWGDFACKLFWFTDESTSYCTALHIASFAIWRFMGVRIPHSYEKVPKRNIRIWVTSIWTVAIIFGGVLYMQLYEVSPKLQDHSVYSYWPDCSIKIQGLRIHRIYYTFSSMAFMILPMIVIMIMSIMIARELLFRGHHKSTKRKRQERRAVMQLALISASFLIGYIPMTSYIMWTTREANKDGNFDYWLHIAAYFCLRMSECLNPIIYNIASGKMRRASSNVIKRILGTHKQVTKKPAKGICRNKTFSLLSHTFGGLSSLSWKDSSPRPTSKHQHIFKPKYFTAYQSRILIVPNKTNI